MCNTLLRITFSLFFLATPALALEVYESKLSPNHVMVLGTDGETKQSFQSIAKYSFRDSSQGEIVFEIGELKAKFAADEYGPVVKPSIFVPTEKFWDEGVLTKDRKRVFVLLRHGSKVEETWSNDDVYEFSVDEYLKNQDGYKLRKISLKTDLEDPSVSEIYSLSDSGDWLLVGVAWRRVQPGTRTVCIVRAPYVLLTRTGELKKVEDLLNCEALATEDEKEKMKKALDKAGP